MIDFCYIGNFLLDYIILFDRKNMNLFITEFSISNSIISLAVIVCDNRADFSNTDFLTSCSIHLIPITSLWAIKWRNRIYSNNDVVNNDFINFDDVKFKFGDEIFKKIFFFRMERGLFGRLFILFYVLLF
jgi:hypothetical protein